MISPTVTRCFQHYDSVDRASMMASHRLGCQKRQSVGEFYYVSSLIPGIAFSTRSWAEREEQKLLIATESKAA